MFPEECRYTNDHEWVRPDGEGFAKVGITTYATEALGEILYVVLPAVGTRLGQMEKFGEIEVVKTTSELFCPVSGEVVELNPKVQADAGIINKEPYDAGWIIRVRMNDPAELEALMTAEVYAEFVRGLTGGE